MKEKAVPFSDVKNILEEIYFEDEKTRSRCREWLALLSRRFLQAESERRVLLSYLSKLTFTFTEDDEVNGPNLPAEETLLKELFLRHRRRSHRTVSNHKLDFSLSSEGRYRCPTI